ncbi:hypothetical protein AVEN_165774-1 [Araneus ventricosus]|uniref:Uncharacterized protein n=1 Tax=Araneus ventricosus TaxID=182803 RepID=A0A4Y2B6U4_ARAVE|nr:hypothetical protein AVEN_165774-1 [Araneus ventricosus]
MPIVANSSVGVALWIPSTRFLEAPRLSIEASTLTPMRKPPLKVQQKWNSGWDGGFSQDVEVGDENTKNVAHNWGHWKVGSGARLRKNGLDSLGEKILETKYIYIGDHNGTIVEQKVPFFHDMHVAQIQNWVQN